MGYLLAGLRLFIYIWVFAIFFLIGAVVHILLFVSKSQRFKWISFFTRWWAKTTCWVLNFQFKIVGEKKPEPGSLIVSNHIGTPDIFILGACFEGFFVSKAEISDWPFFQFTSLAGNDNFCRQKT